MLQVAGTFAAQVKQSFAGCSHEVLEGCRHVAVAPGGQQPVELLEVFPPAPMEIRIFQVIERDGELLHGRSRCLQRLQGARIPVLLCEHGSLLHVLQAPLLFQQPEPGHPAEHQAQPSQNGAGHKHISHHGGISPQRIVCHPTCLSLQRVPFKRTAPPVSHTLL